MTANVLGTNYNKLSQITVPQANSKGWICLKWITDGRWTKVPDSNEDLVIWCSDDVSDLSRENGGLVANEDRAVALVTSSNGKHTAMHCIVAQIFRCARDRRNSWSWHEFGLKMRSKDRDIGEKAVSYFGVDEFLKKCLTVFDSLRTFTLAEQGSQIGRFDKGGGNRLFQLAILEVMWYTLQKADQPFKRKSPPSVHRAIRKKVFGKMEGHVVVGSKLVIRHKVPKAI